jgi:hypothetical protein
MKNKYLQGAAVLLFVSALVLSCKEETAKTIVSQQPASLSYF